MKLQWLCCNTADKWCSDVFLEEGERGRGMEVVKLLERGFGDELSCCMGHLSTVYLQNFQSIFK